MQTAAASMANTLSTSSVMCCDVMCDVTTGISVSPVFLDGRLSGQTTVVHSVIAETTGQRNPEP